MSLKSCMVRYGAVSYTHLVEYVYQDVETIPEEKRNPKRKALYGSVRAVLMGEELIDSPFGVIRCV